MAVLSTSTSKPQSQSAVTERTGTTAKTTVLDPDQPKNDEEDEDQDPRANLGNETADQSTITTKCTNLVITQMMVETAQERAELAVVGLAEVGQAALPEVGRKAVILRAL